jgi:hypothetical protein
LDHSGLAPNNHMQSQSTHVAMDEGNEAVFS